jgi:hypothetical protein
MCAKKHNMIICAKKHDIIIVVGNHSHMILRPLRRRDRRCLAAALLPWEMKAADASELVATRRKLPFAARAAGFGLHVKDFFQKKTSRPILQRS